MNLEVLLFVLDKVKIANATKAGLVLSYVVFKGFDIKGRVERAMQPKSV